jgi:hypothetical protein
MRIMRGLYNAAPSDGTPFRCVIWETRTNMPDQNPLFSEALQHSRLVKVPTRALFGDDGRWALDPPNRALDTILPTQRFQPPRDHLA